MADKGEMKVPIGLPDAVFLPSMKQYVAKAYPVIELRSDQELETVITKVMKNTKGSQSSKNLRSTVETALFSTAVFNLRMTSPEQPGGSVSVAVPGELLETSRHVQHLEILFATKTGSTELTNGPQFSLVARGMQSLKDQFLQLETLVVRLCINVASPTVEKVKAGGWMKEAQSIINNSTFQIASTHMLRMAKNVGPGRRKVFKLSVEAHVETVDGIQLRKPNGKGWIRHSDEVEFTDLYDTHMVVSTAWKSCETASVD